MKHSVQRHFVVTMWFAKNEPTKKEQEKATKKKREEKNGELNNVNVVVGELQISSEYKQNRTEKKNVNDYDLMYRFKWVLLITSVLCVFNISWNELQQLRYLPCYSTSTNGKRNKSSEWTTEKKIAASEPFSLAQCKRCDLYNKTANNTENLSLLITNPSIWCICISWKDVMPCDFNLCK